MPREWQVMTNTRTPKCALTTKMYAPSLMRADAHIGSRDCLHYCIPGGPHLLWVDALVHGELRKGIWRITGKKGHYKYIQTEGVEMRDETIEEQGGGKLTGMAIDAKKHMLLRNITTASAASTPPILQAHCCTRWIAPLDDHRLKQ